MALEVCQPRVLASPDRVDAEVRRVADDRVETAGVEHLGELVAPAERVVGEALLLGQIEGHREIDVDDAVPAPHVPAQVGKEPTDRQLHLGLALDHLEEQRQLGDLDGLRVDVDTMDVVEEDPLALGRRRRTPPAGVPSRYFFSDRDPVA